MREGVREGAQKQVDHDTMTAALTPFDVVCDGDDEQRSVGGGAVLTDSQSLFGKLTHFCSTIAFNYEAGLPMGNF